jgi:hypothetical protein
VIQNFFWTCFHLKIWKKHSFTRYLTNSESFGLTVEYWAHDWKVMGSNSVQCFMELVLFYIRGGQSAALRRFSAAPVSNFDALLSYLWQIYVRKRPKIDINYVKKIKNKEFLWPPIQYLNEIWLIDKKVWPPLFYMIACAWFSSLMLQMFGKLILCWEVKKVG